MNRKSPKHAEETALGPEDALLWERVAGTAKPLTRGRDRRLAVPGEDAAAWREPKTAKARLPHLKQTAPAAKPPPERPSPPLLARFDAREARQLRSGRADIDARVDLHGMRQREAHGALKAFLARAQAAGQRTVLVITGKGGAKSAVDTETYGAAGEAPGVLKAAVPRWLAEPELRRYVVSYTQAAPRHGGEGALYVRLRRGKVT